MFPHIGEYYINYSKIWKSAPTDYKKKEISCISVNLDKQMWTLDIKKMPI